ncbi:MAG TPA: bifunctional riboflavin kinase/FAD synthetase [Luteolibacter sp.]|nr:bifunctional riboflavin kinase/FAD synthetase [Luteolibacter sp.]
MLIRHQLEELPALGEPLHLALGVFDGLHLGHQAVVARAVAAAQNDGGLAGVLTFDPHPIRVIAPAKAPASLLETLDHKACVCAGLGVHLIVPLHFDAAMARMEARDFIARLCATPVRTIAVGEDWRFGHRRAGDVALLHEAAARYGFRLEAVPPVMFDGDRISSTRIRQAIHDGNLDEAERMLGRRYSVTGTVVEGAKLGRQLGFPTANVHTGNLQLPPDGVWAVRAIDPAGRRWNGAANLGTRPTVDGTKRLLEVHLIGFSGDLYGGSLEVVFEKQLRAERKFDGLEELRAQISTDVEAAREALA